MIVRLRLLLVALALALALVASQNALFRSWQEEEPSRVSACERPGCVAAIQPPAQPGSDSAAFAWRL